MKYEMIAFELISYGLSRSQDIFFREWDRSAQIFPKYRNYLKILGARMVTQSMFHTEDIIRGHGMKFSQHGDLSTKICAPLALKQKV
jgi:hypothetical protein